MPPDVPNRDDPVFLRSVLGDLRDAYARLLALVEQSLQTDPETDPEAVQVFQPQIQQLMEETDTRMGILMEFIRPWEDRRKVFPPELVAEIDRFMELLEKGLTTVKGQLDARVEDLQQRQKQVRQALDELNQKRQGVPGYRQKDPQSKLVNRKI